MRAGTAFRRQLGWRDFYQHVLLHNPRNARDEHQERYRGTLEWDGADEAARRLARGPDRLPARRRGHAPAAARGLDAQPRPARHRARSSRRTWASTGAAGERHFMRLLIDGDEANNNGNWQWIASVGVDPAAVLPPHLQPDAAHGALRPRRRVRAPLRARAARTCRTSICASRGRCPTRSSAPRLRDRRDYPEPIVDRARRAREAIERLPGRGCRLSRRSARRAAGSPSGARAEISRL